MELLLVVAAMALQAMYAGSETAVVRANWVRLGSWASERRRGALLAQETLARQEHFLLTSLIGANLFMILSSSLAAHYVIKALGPALTWVSVLVITATTLVFAQFLPKSLAQVRPESWLCRLGAPLAFSERIFAPLINLLGRISGADYPRDARPKLTRSDVLLALRQGVASSVGSERLSGIAARLLEFPEVKVGEVMTPLKRVIALPEGTGLDRIRQVAAEHPYTRLPVFRQRRDNIIGVIFIRDLILAERQVMRKPFFVTEHARAIEVMNQMRATGEHLACVRDGAQRTIGIVTLEDLLEELVGEIRSED